MKVTLAALTVPEVEGINSAEEFVAYAARVSNPGNQMNSESAPKLLQYLVRNKHWSPFEMVSMTLEIETTRDIAHQIIRHRSFSFQEFSQRYANIDAMGFTLAEARLQDAKNRQASIETQDSYLQREWEYKQNLIIDLAKQTYDWGIQKGIAKECARKVLPEGLTNTRLYMAGSLRSWLHYCIERTAMGTQKEHREVAEGAVLVLNNEFPSITGILNEAK